MGSITMKASSSFALWPPPWPRPTPSSSTTATPATTPPPTPMAAPTAPTPTATSMAPATSTSVRQRQGRPRPCLQHRCPRSPLPHDLRHPQLRLQPCRLPLHLRLCPPHGQEGGRG